MNGRYSGHQLGVVVPTKDRPQKIQNLLTSLAAQTVPCGRIIVVDGGQSVKHIVLSFSDRLPVEYYECHPPGQIRQRNMAIALLDTRTPLVAFLDDDLVLETDALENMIDFWNSADPNTAGVGFNVINTPRHRCSALESFFLMSSPVQGRILRSGRNVSIQHIQTNLKTQWLGGGFTVWKREIILKHPQDHLNTRWATGEDLRFSYPIGKRYPLYVCAAARVRHEHVYDQAPANGLHRYIGRKGSLGFFYFVESHPEFSRAACLWMLTGIALTTFLYGCGTLSRRKLANALGQFEAILLCLKSIVGCTNLRSELED
jgi:glycosyltransferase involved in cell wall biosynthesis